MLQGCEEDREMTSQLDVEFFSPVSIQGFRSYWKPYLDKLEQKGYSYGITVSGDCCTRMKYKGRTYERTIAMERSIDHMRIKLGELTKEK